jgi:hypothetical protein
MVDCCVIRSEQIHSKRVLISSGQSFRFKSPGNYQARTWITPFYLNQVYEYFQLSLVLFLNLMLVGGET